MKEKKSTNYYVELPSDLTRRQIMKAVERAADASGQFISHIGGNSRKKYPNAMHRHFKRDA